MRSKKQCHSIFDQSPQKILTQFGEAEAWPHCALIADLRYCRKTSKQSGQWCQ